MKVVAGVDCHKDTHTVAVLDNIGKVLQEFVIAANPSGYREAITKVSNHAEVVWGLEGTGVYGRAFAKALVAAGMVVFEVPGAVTKRHRRRGSRHGKTDATDARAIAEAVLRESDRLPRFHEAEEREALRLRYDQPDRLVRERTVLINRLRSNALRLGMNDVPASLTSTASLTKLLEVAEMRRGANLIDDALIDEISFSVGALQGLNERIAHLERVMRPFVKRLAPELLELHGVSTVVAAGLAGHAGDLRNFRNADAFAMHSATAPVPWSSGRSEAVRVNLGGNRQLNRLLHMIALSQIRSANHPGRRYFERKLTEGKAPRTALAWSWPCVDTVVRMA